MAIDERLARIEEMLERIGPMVERVDTAIRGDGADLPGLNGRVKTLEDREAGRRWRDRTIVGAAVAAVAGAATSVFFGK